MAKERLSMRKIKEVLRLKFKCGLGIRQIGRSIKASHSTVSDYLHRAKKKGINSWPLDPDIDDNKLEELLFPEDPSSKSASKHFPNFTKIHKELKCKGVTLFLLWEEYKEIYTEGYSYSQFCEHYSQFKKSQEICLRQNYYGGDKMFVDYAGQTIPIQNPSTGEIAYAQLFVACLGASNYSYAEATWTQSLPDWIKCHIHAYEYFQGVPNATVPDNLKSGVSRACRYDPDINPTYQEMAEYYGTAIVPARKRKPRDKAKVEAGVLVVERWIIAALRNHVFFRLEQLNQAIAQLLEKLNHRSFKKLPGCRYQLYREVDVPALNPLPEKPYEYAEWKQPTVHIDYHVEIKKHYYSVPYTYTRKKLDARITDKTIEIFYQGSRIASHVRSYKKGGFSTIESHRPPKHQEYLKWNPERFLKWASKIGPYCKDYIQGILTSRRYPEQGYRTCLGVLRLSNSYPHEKMEQACKRALSLQVYSYKIIDSLLKRKREEPVKPEKGSESLSYQHTHENVRGSHYYQ
jgi:transposase